MNNFIETNKLISYNLKATYLTHDVNMTITVDDLNNIVTNPLNGNVNLSDSYIGFRFDKDFVLQNEDDLTPVINPELLIFIKQLGADIKVKYNL